MRVAVIFVAGLLLSGCVSPTGIASRSITVTPAVAAMPTGGTAWRDWARQTNQEIRAKVVGVRADGEAFFAERVAAAAEVDAGRMTPEQFDVYQRRRLAAIEATDRANMQAASDALIVAGASISAARPTYVAPTPIDSSPSLLRQPVNCTSQRFGQMVHTNCF
ncbi:hypothetical protein PUR29_14145 [Methylobacterium ajmalii]|uniref:Lipoprotein n=1 Tax=Methylobacterium ajmalii TaxID=2738439 RepID=A0ABU9ZT58_9HYPH